MLWGEREEGDNKGDKINRMEGTRPSTDTISSFIIRISRSEKPIQGKEPFDR